MLNENETKAHIKGCQLSSAYY